MTAANQHHVSRLLVLGLGAILAACQSNSAPATSFGQTLGPRLESGRAAPYFANRTAAQPVAEASSNLDLLVPNRHSTTASEPAHAAGFYRPWRQASAPSQPRGMVYFRAAGGTEEVETKSSGNTATADTDAVFAEVGFEATGRLIGGGFRLGGYQTDDDLLESSGTIDTSSDGVNFFAHLTIRPGGQRFRVPIRIGPEIISNTTSYSGGVFASVSELEWLSVGGAIEAEPEFDFFRTDRSALSLYGRAHLGVGVAQVSSPSQDFDTTSTTFAGEIGLRLQLAKFLLSGGYMFSQTNYDESDPESLVTIDETTWSFDGVFLALGVRW